MKKHFMMVAAFAVAMVLGFSSCTEKNTPSGGGGGSKDKAEDMGDPSKGVITADQSKARIANIAKTLIGKFNTADQKEAIELADGIYEKYKEYSFDDFEGMYWHRYDDLFALPKYAKHVLRGDISPTGIHEYFFSFEGESAIWEANDKTHTWEYMGKPSDNSVIFRCKDKNGVLTEAKLWGEGETHYLEYMWEDYHWEYGTVPVGATVHPLYLYAYGMINGVWTYINYKDGVWFYYDEQGLEVIMDRQPDWEIYALCDDDLTHNYDFDNDFLFDYDYEQEYKIVDGTRIAKGELPAKVQFTLTQGNNELIHVTLDQDLLKNDHADIHVDARVVNLQWLVDLNIKSHSGFAGVEFLCGKESIMKMIANLPSYELIDKDDQQSFEEWMDLYMDRYEELLRQVGNADVMLDFNGLLQFKAGFKNVGSMYSELARLTDESKEGAQRGCDIINDGLENGIYYGSEFKQAEMRLQVASREEEEWYYDDDGQQHVRTYVEFYPEPVLFFPQDETTYSFEQYFDRKPFTDLTKTIEDLANAYLKLSKALFDYAGGEVEI